jgi:hypothetical protein
MTKRVVCAVVVILLSSTAALARGNYRSEDRYNPEHISELPPEVRALVVRECADPRALHTFADYSDPRKIVLHYEHFYCQGHDVFCPATGCLHHVFVLINGHYRLEQSYYGER